MLNLCHRIGQEGKVPHTGSRLRAGSPEQVTGSIVYRVELAHGPQCPMRLRCGLEVTASGRMWPVVHLNLQMLEARRGGTSI